MSQNKRQKEKVAEKATRGSGKVTTMEARANKTKGISYLEHTLLSQSTRRHMLDLYLCATSANFTIMGRALSECLIVKFHKCVDMIHERVRASKPKTMQDAIEIATKLMNKKISTLAECQTENKKRLDNTSKNNQNQQQQQPNKRQNTGRVYIAASGERKEYAGTLPLYNKCKFHHNGQCTVKCVNCKRVGHLTRDCRSPAATNNHRNPTCYGCGNQWHYRSDCLELKNLDHGNQAGGTGAHGMVHALKGGETNQDPNDVEDDINA
nr:hypothetical protein [Tanacetum cinerariifolium]